MKIHVLLLAIVLGCLPIQIAAQGLEDKPHNQTVESVVPNGCFATIPTTLAPPLNQVLVNETVEVERLFGFNEFRVRVWRHGCHEPNRSVLLINLKGTQGIDRNMTPNPNVSIYDPQTDQTFNARLTLWHLDQAHLYENYLGFLGGNERFPWGWTYLLDIRTLEAVDLYNSAFELVLSWGGPSRIFRFEIPEYDPVRDAPQTVLPEFHGRYSGQWVVDGLPGSGLVLQIGEVPGTDRNFMFAIWFTYIEGSPTWVVGNADFNIGANEVELEMFSMTGGEFLTQPGSFTRDDIQADPIGIMTIRANHCNEIEADIDFSPAGEGTAFLTFNRLVRIAGYDCDQTQ